MFIGWLTCIPAVLLPHSLCRSTTANAPANRQMPIASVVSSYGKKNKKMKRIAFISLLILTTISTFAHKERWDDRRKDWTKLMLTIYDSKTAEYHKLIESGVNVNQVASGKTALEVAIMTQNEDAVNALLKTNKIKRFGLCLDLAAGRENFRIVELLIKYGVDPNKNRENGHSALMTAVNFGSYDVIETLLKHNAKVNHARTVDGMTPLMFAAYNGKIQNVKLLLSYKADKRIKDKNGKTALYYVDNGLLSSESSANIKNELRKLLK